MADRIQITDALAKLDHANPEHWTDDGLPRTSAVQKLVGDATIKRSDIQAAAPDFARKLPTDAEGAALTLEGNGGIKSAPQAPIEPVIKDEDEPLTEDEVKMILDQNVHDADQALASAVANVTEAERIVREAQKAFAAAREAKQSAFPPISAAENIRQHLAREQARLRERVEGRAPPNAGDPLRRYSRPERQFTLPDGRVVTAGPRMQTSRKFPDLINKRAIA